MGLKYDSIPKLRGAKDWDLWRIRIRALLAEKGYIDAINSRKEFSKNTTKEIIESYNEERKKISIKAAAIIRLTLDDAPLIQTKNIEESDAEELYNRLKTLYEPKGFSSEFLIAKELFSTTLKRSNNSIENYLTKIRSLTDDLSARDKAIPVEIIAAYTLNNLTKEYDYIVAAINQSFRNKEQIDLDNLFSQIVDESRRIQDKEEKEEVALYTKTKNTDRKEPKRCFYCEKIGHIARNCRIKKKEEEKEEKEEKATIAL